ncbi:MAG: dihydroorotase [Ruminococcaceae bacterium]|nr:dihydroorotase [Oscillospiraceae bacterium]
MKYAIIGASVYDGGCFKKKNIFIDNGVVSEISERAANNDGSLFEFENCYVFPGFVDVHVHLREPGFSYKETVESGTMAAARGGFTAVCSMPNLNPVPDSIENLKQQLDIIEKDAVISVYPFGSITCGQNGEKLSDMEGMTENVIGFSDDGKGVQSEEMMREAMKKAKSLDKIISAHCEENSLLKGGYIHDGEYAKLNGHKGICSESEWAPIKRDVELIKETGVSYHVCHISAKESVDIIRKAKAEGVDITCETGPHYLTLCDMDIKDEGRFKMNPPIRSAKDRDALVEGMLDGTVDMIATDHAPHSYEEKSKGLSGSNMGVVGIETSFPVMYTEFVKTGKLTLEKLIELMSINPAKRFGIKTGIKVGEKADFTVFDLDEKYTVNPDDFLSKGKATPFEGKEVFGRCKMTVANGNIAYKEEK